MDKHKHKWHTRFVTVEGVDSASGLVCDCGEKYRQDEVEDVFNNFDIKRPKMIYLLPESIIVSVIFNGAEVTIDGASVVNCTFHKCDIIIIDESKCFNCTYDECDVIRQPETSAENPVVAQAEPQRQEVDVGRTNKLLH